MSGGPRRFFHARHLADGRLHNYDVADALAMYTVAGYVIANNLRTEPTPARYKAIRAQLADAVAQTPSYRSYTARAREETKIKLVALSVGHFFY